VQCRWPASVCPAAHAGTESCLLRQAAMPGEVWPAVSRKEAARQRKGGGSELNENIQAVQFACMPTHRPGGRGREGGRHHRWEGAGGGRGHSKQALGHRVKDVYRCERRQRGRGQAVRWQKVQEDKCMWHVQAEVEVVAGSTE